MLSRPRRARPASLPAVLLLAALVLILLEPVVLPAQGQAVRKQIKLARRDLVAFEKEVEAVVESLEHLQAEEGELSEEMKSIRKVLRKLDDADTLYERWRSALFGSLLAASLEDIKARREIVSALVPQLRRHIWEKGLERKEKINTLQEAIELLQSARAGDLITKAGVGGGQLITYSADWAAVAMCESSGRWHIDDYFDGGLQFLPSTWWGFGGGQYGHYAYQATRRQQIDIAERVLAVQGPNAWPNCFKALPADTDE